MLTMSLSSNSVESMTLYNTLKTFTFRGTSNVNEITFFTGAFNEILQPNQKITFDRKNRSLNVSTVDAERYSAWKEGYLIIDNETLEQVKSRIERWYNVKVEIADEELFQFSFRATFENDSLEDMLKQLSMTSPIEYKIFPRKQFPDGTSEKKKAILYRKRI